jgi:hypothetical protein
MLNALKKYAFPPGFTQRFQKKLHFYVKSELKHKKLRNLSGRRQVIYGSLVSLSTSANLRYKRGGWGRGCKRYYPFLGFKYLFSFV